MTSWQGTAWWQKNNVYLKKKQLGKTRVGTIIYHIHVYIYNVHYTYTFVYTYTYTCIYIHTYNLIFNCRGGCCVFSTFGWQPWDVREVSERSFKAIMCLVNEVLYLIEDLLVYKTCTRRYCVCIQRMGAIKHMVPEACMNKIRTTSSSWHGTYSECCKILYIHSNYNYSRYMQIQQYALTYALPQTNIDLENCWLGDKPFFVGPGLFSGASCWHHRCLVTL